MTEIATPRPVALPLGPAPQPIAPATPLASSPVPASGRSAWRRLASAVSDAHRAAVPF